MTQLRAENPLRVGLRRDRGAEPCTIVIFGASGDLTQRKLVPALYNLHLDRLLPTGFAVAGVARREMSDEAFVTDMREATRRHSRRAMTEQSWAEIAGGLSYVTVGSQKQDYRRLAEHLDRLDRERGTGGNRLFYLATPPSAFPRIVKGLQSSGLSVGRRDGSRRDQPTPPAQHRVPDAFVHGPIA